MILWFNPTILYFFSRFRNVLSQMSPPEISSYLSTNILTIGISSITPMMYLSMDTFKSLRNADQTKNGFNECSGVSTLQNSICLFLLVMMVIKVVIAPLSTTNLTTDDSIKLNLSRSFIFQGTIYALSFLLNLYLFANMEEGRATDSIFNIAVTAIILAGIPISLEFFHMIFYRAHRTFHAPTTQRSLTSPPSSEISLSSTNSLSRNPTEGGATAGFV